MKVDEPKWHAMAQSNVENWLKLADHVLIHFNHHQLDISYKEEKVSNLY